MKMKDLLIVILLLFVFGMAYDLRTYGKQIKDLQIQLEMCQEHNEFLNEERKNYIKTHQQIREYWRIKCGCFTVDEVVAALTGEGRSDG